MSKAVFKAKASISISDDNSMMYPTSTTTLGTKRKSNSYETNYFDEIIKSVDNNNFRVSVGTNNENTRKLQILAASALSLDNVESSRHVGTVRESLKALQVPVVKSHPKQYEYEGKAENIHNGKKYCNSVVRTNSNSINGNNSSKLRTTSNSIVDERRTLIEGPTQIENMYHKLVTGIPKKLKNQSLYMRFKNAMLEDACSKGLKDKILSITHDAKTGWKIVKNIPITSNNAIAPTTTSTHTSKEERVPVGSGCQNVVSINHVELYHKENDFVGNPNSIGFRNPKGYNIDELIELKRKAIKDGQLEMIDYGNRMVGWYKQFEPYAIKHITNLIAATKQIPASNKNSPKLNNVIQTIEGVLGTYASSTAMALGRNNQNVGSSTVALQTVLREAKFTSQQSIATMANKS